MTEPVLSASADLIKRALDLMPGGVSSPVRAFGAVGGSPIFIASGKGAWVTDVDGNEYIDMLSSWGPLILGHAHPEVVSAIVEAASHGTSFGAPTALEVELAETIVEAIPSVEMVRFVSTGTEAAMSAIRLARAFTGRSKVIKFSGCYHGHSDPLLVSAGSGPATLGLPDSPGVTEGARADTVVASFNSVEEVTLAFERFGDDLAAVIVEPIAANMGVVLPSPGFLQFLRDICSQAGALLIFDEVVTGFRVGWSGAQSALGVSPDITILGKVVGGGLPVGAYGGRRELMQMVAPSGPVYQAGTLSGNPVAIAAGLATLRTLVPADYPRLEALGLRLEKGLAGAARAQGIAACVQRAGSMLTLFFERGPVTDLASAKHSDTARFALFFHEMLSRGVYWPPSQFESAFVSTAHTEGDIDRVVEAAHQSFERIR